MKSNELKEYKRSNKNALRLLDDFNYVLLGRHLSLLGAVELRLKLKPRKS